MKLSELLARVPIAARRGTNHDPDITAITDDSRKAGPGALFVAVKGESSDGHDYIATAIKAGAAAVVAQREIETPSGTVLIQVDNSARFLALAASVWHGLDRIQQRGELPIVAVTGTNGKTTSTYIIQAMLAAAGKPTAVIGTVTYDLIGRKIAAPWTTPPPLALAEMLVEAYGHGARAVAIETSSHALQQHRVDGLRYSAAIFTNLTGDHLDYHGTMEAYLSAKKRLFDMLDADATAVTNMDDAAGEKIVADCRGRVIRFSIDNDAALRGRIHEMTAAGSVVDVSFEGQYHRLTTPLLGRHNVQNLLGAIGAGLGLGLSLGQACDGAGGLASVRGRLETVDAGQPFAIVVDYAHTDDALRNVLSALRPLTTGQLICVFGCGGDRDRTKRPRMASVAAELADRIIVTSDNPRTESPEAIIEEIRAGFEASDLPRCHFVTDRAAAIAAAVAEGRPGDTILIAGKGHEDYQILGTQRIHFDDVEVARAAVESRDFPSRDRKGAGSQTVTNDTPNKLATV